ncbi:hypothetical protein L3X38_009247 [Prunus dulcis]|uniref:Uncharacterized protein n=1 Tax=Prunus dulcis TaxID=3755 RepID=A0AAD4ZY20_PRUDU|nr:hypothetical protein L3X38_009247 [Prunus dulcis]
MPIPLLPSSLIFRYFWILFHSSKKKKSLPISSFFPSSSSTAAPRPYKFRGLFLIVIQGPREEREGGCSCQVGQLVIILIIRSAAYHI